MCILNIQNVHVSHCSNDLSGISSFFDGLYISSLVEHIQQGLEGIESCKQGFTVHTACIINIQLLVERTNEK